MKVKIVAVGKLKETYLKQGIAEYAKRLNKYCQFEIIEVADEKAPESLSETEMAQIKAKEGQRILSKIKEQEYVYTLEINGKDVTSEEFAASMDKAMTLGKSTLTFVIGGSLGLSPEVIHRSQESLSFGRVTYPHQLMRLILSEQVYRSFRILNGHAYHK